MRKSVFMSLVLLAGLSLGVLNSSCRQTQQSGTEPETEMGTEMGVEAEGVQYTCPMHPEVISDEPGSCPICGMDLIAVSETGMDMVMDADTTM